VDLAEFFRQANAAGCGEKNMGSSARMNSAADNGRQAWPMQQSRSDWQLFFYLLIRISVSYLALWRHMDKIEQKYLAKLT
jgi:hypothetical protein